ncbi:reverse transcriptase domain-containing protein [Trichonephila clavipes]|nr:reverse transcriptase domain-containing protein [Trichonephila clavipes]
MNCAILSDTDNVTTFGVADSPRVEVRAHDKKYATRTLNILQLNINGTQRKLEELTEIFNVNKKIIKSAIIDHFPIITSINQRVDGTTQSKRSWNFRKANWEKFTSELETLCSLSSPHTLYERLQSFSSHINAAAKHSIPTVKRIDDRITFWKDTNIKKLINERDKLSRERQKNNTETNRTRLMNLCHEVQEVIFSCSRKKSTEFCETLDPPKISQHWKVIKTLNNQSTHQKANLLSNIISSSGRDAATNKETASLLAKHYENKSKLTFIANDRKLLRTYRKNIQDSKRYNYKNIFTIPFSMEELEAAIAKMNPGKAPGPDVIFGCMVQHFGNLAKKELLEIFNFSCATGKLPKIWKLSIVIPILKPNKNASECKHYRPIALSSFLCTLMERNLAECGLEFHRLFDIFMNTIHHHIHPDTKIACHADDIAVWHSHYDITESEKALNTKLKGIAAWAENLKLTINADKTNYCIFSTDRRHRSSFTANIKIQSSQIKKVDLLTYLGVTLDPELCFSKHIEQIANKDLGKLNILRRLCGTSWDSQDPKS